MRPKYDIELPVFRSGLSGDDLQEVDHTSPKDQRIAVESIAWFFKREMNFDTIQFDAEERPTQPGVAPYAAYLFVETAYDLLTEEDTSMVYRAIGAACFRRTTNIDRSERWLMSWIWIHPYARRQGLLSNQWSTFRTNHGAFSLELPLSEAMKSFMKRNGFEPSTS